MSVLGAEQHGTVSWHAIRTRANAVCGGRRNGWMSLGIG